MYEIVHGPAACEANMEQTPGLFRQAARRQSWHVSRLLIKQPVPDPPQALKRSSLFSEILCKNYHVQDAMTDFFPVTVYPKTTYVKFPCPESACLVRSITYCLVFHQPS